MKSKKNEIKTGVSPQGGTLSLIFSYVGSGHFSGFKILNFDILGDFQKNEYFGGYEDFVDIFWGHHKLDYMQGSFLRILRSFLKVKVQNGGYFFGLLKFHIFFGGA